MSEAGVLMLGNGRCTLQQNVFPSKPKILDTVGPGCVCEKKYFVLPFCIM